MVEVTEDIRTAQLCCHSVEKYLICSVAARCNINIGLARCQTPLSHMARASWLIHSTVIFLLSLRLAEFHAKVFHLSHEPKITKAKNKA